VAELARGIRSHWGIENKVHWVLDVVFREDDSRVRAGHAAENLGWLRRVALALLKQEDGKDSIQCKRLKAGWDNDFLEKVLGLLDQNLLSGKKYAPTLVHSVLDADMNLAVPDLKPQAAPRLQAGRLFDFRQAERLAVEAAGLVLGPLGDGKLDMVNAENRTGATWPWILHLPGGLLGLLLAEQPANDVAGRVDPRRRSALAVVEEGSQWPAERVGRRTAACA
jgi:hypothetical protein